MYFYLVKKHIKKIIKNKAEKYMKTAIQEFGELL